MYVVYWLKWRNKVCVCVCVCARVLVNFFFFFLISCCSVSEDTRLWLTPLVQPCLMALGSGTECNDASFQALRALGNLCFDCDANRAKVDSVEAIVAYMRAASTPLMKRVAAGAVLNLCVDNVAQQEQCAQKGAVDVLIAYVIEVRKGRRR